MKPQSHAPVPEADERLKHVHAAFGAAMRRCRIEKSISMHELAERSGIHVNYIGSVERGERNVSLNNIWRIALGLDVKTAKLLEDLPRLSAKGKIKKDKATRVETARPADAAK